MEEKNPEEIVKKRYPNDIGLWPQQMSESFREYWLSHGSKECQHQNSDFKNSANKGKDRTRHCTRSLFTKKHSLSWEAFDLPWLCYSESQGKLYCFICKLLSKTESNFTEGFCNWKKAGEKIDSHCKSQSYQEALADAFVRSKTSSRIDKNLVQAIELES